MRVEPFVLPKRSLTGDNTERVDTRVLQVLYEITADGRTGEPHRRAADGSPRVCDSGCGGCVFDYEHEHEHEVFL